MFIFRLLLPISFNSQEFRVKVHLKNSAIIKHQIDTKNCKLLEQFGHFSHDGYLYREATGIWDTTTRHSRLFCVSTCGLDLLP